MTTPLQKAFKQANAITRLAGYEPTPADLAIQERVIQGEISLDDAVDEIIKGHSLRQRTNQYPSGREI